MVYRKRDVAVLLALLFVTLVAGCQAKPYQSQTGPLRGFLGRLLGHGGNPVLDRCLESVDETYDELPGVISSVVAERDITSLSQYGWETTFMAVAREAGITHMGIALTVSGGDNDTFLAAVEWCRGNSNYQFYIIDASGQVWGVDDIQDMPTVVDVQWLGSAWAVITDVGSGLHVVTFRLIAERDGEWAMIYRSDQPPDGGALLMWSSAEMPTLTFVNGYDRLIVKWIKPGGPTIRTTYQWESGAYVQVDEVEPEADGPD